MERVVYKECQKNHTASSGKYTFDGCREYVKNTRTPDHCLVCSCHRSYHRRLTYVDLEVPMIDVNAAPPSPESEVSSAASTGGVVAAAPAVAAPAVPVPLAVHGVRTTLRMMKQMARSRIPLPTSPPVQETPARGTETPAAAAIPLRSNPGESSRQRPTRPRFSRAEREILHAFAETLGWTIRSKHRKDEINRFCEDMGMSRKTFKNWINNHKKLYRDGTGSSGAASTSHI